MTIVRLGNTAPVETRRENEEDPGERVALDVPDGGSVTEIRIPDDIPLTEALVAVTQPGRGAWDAHSDEPPAWVSSDDQQFAELLASNYSVSGHKCEVREWDGDDTPVGLTASDTPEAAAEATTSSHSRTSRRRGAAADDEEKE